MIFHSNEQIIKELKIVFMREDTSGTKLAKEMGMSQQNFSKKLQKKNLSFENIATILDMLGYDLEINFIKRN